MSPQLNQDVKDRLYASYCQIAGEAPSEVTMTQLQQAYINYKVDTCTPYIKNTAHISFKVNPPSPFIPALSAPKIPWLMNLASHLPLYLRVLATIPSGDPKQHWKGIHPLLVHLWPPQNH